MVMLVGILCCVVSFLIGWKLSRRFHSNENREIYDRSKIRSNNTDYDIED